MPLSQLGVDLALDLYLLILEHGGVVAGPPEDDDGSAFFASADAELLGSPDLTADTAPNCESEEGEAACDPQAPPTSKRPCSCDYLPNMPGACDKLGSKLGVMLFPRTSHEHSISSRFLAPSLYDFFAPFLPFGHQYLNASISLSVLMSTKSSSTISSQ